MTPSGGRASEFSAGGVVVRGEDVAVIVPRRRAADGRRVLALPKGHVDPGETAPQAASREVREETGLETRLVEKLGDVRYFYQREGRRVAKVVAFYLFEYVAGDVADHDHEIEEARWLSVARAARELTYKGEREMVQRALSRIRADR